MSIFSKIAVRRPKRNKFNLSHSRKMSLEMGKLIPILCQEVVPGDKFRIKTEMMMRFAPMLAPIMHNVDVKVDYFKVPMRLIWDEWEKFITGGEDGTAAPVPPFMKMDVNSAGSFGIGSLADYLGVPTIDNYTVQEPEEISSLPFRAYQLIYNEYYRDQNLTAPITVPKTSGEETTYINLTTLRHSAWQKDYFTAALPWTQRGPEALIPMEGDSTITYKDQSIVNDAQTGDPAIDGSIDSDNGVTIVDGSMGTRPIRIENIESVEFENATVTINDLRRTIKLQEWLEKNARGGARYIEQIFSHFGVKSSDARLQRPEYLGGGKMPVSISEVLSTVEATNIPQANMAGHGIATGTTAKTSTFCEEHAFIIGILRVIPRTGYMQGLPKMFSRKDKFDYYWPEFAHLGEQEIKNKEVYFAQYADDYNNATFGYTPRYAEYKFGLDTVHGAMRDSLDYWHMARKFEQNEPPALNTEFVECRPSTRIFAVEDEEHLYCQLWNNVEALRPMPYFGTPTI